MDDIRAFYVYLLRCPGGTYYVGKGSDNPSISYSRLQESIKEKYAVDHLLLCVNIINESEAYLLEQRYITLYLSWGYKLLNSRYAKLYEGKLCCSLVSEETKKKLRVANLGEKNPQYGKLVASETREKLRLANSGRKHTEEVRLKISKGNLGKKRSKETREKIRSKNLGKKLSPETIQKMKERKFSLETREKIRVRALERYREKNNG